MRRLAVLAGVLCACGGTPEQVTPELPTRVLYASGTTTYEISTRARQVQEMQGQTQSAETAFRFQLTVALAEAANGFDVTFTVDSVLELNTPMIPASQAATLNGVRFTAPLSATGSLGEITAGSDGALAQQVVGQLRFFFPELPAGGAEAGATWTDSVSAQIPSAQVNLTSLAHNSYTAGPWAQLDGMRSLPLAVSSTFSLTGTGEQMGAEFVFDGEGRSRGTIHLSPTGQLLRAASADTINAEVSVQMAGLIIPLRITSTDSVRVIR